MLEAFPVTTVIGPLVILIVIIYTAGIIRYIPNDSIGILEKLWSRKGSIKDGFIALNGEAGFQPNVLRGGFHFFVPFQYRVHKAHLVTIPQGQIGYVFARDGVPLPAIQTLGSNKIANNFEDTEEFLKKGGQKGPQRKILREGTYAINLAQFIVLTENRDYSKNLELSDASLILQMGKLISDRNGYEAVIIKDADDLIGIVTVHDGPALPEGEIIAPTVGSDPVNQETFHNNFQDPERFIDAGGFRGRQHHALVDGSYYINRLFATIELINKTVIDVGTVGVVVSYIGEQGNDTSGHMYRHGELVQPGFRGVWNRPLPPGKYAFNTYAGKVITVPTTNFVLKWMKSDFGQHYFDENLSEVSLITKDAFRPTLPLSVVVHIDYMKAPYVVQRFGDVKRLVEQTLDPMVSAYFKNVAQTKTIIELLQDRNEIQDRSSEEMRCKFSAYSLDLQEVLIGTPRADDEHGKGFEQILLQLRNRQIAVEQVETYKLQEAASIQERTLKEKQAMAEQKTQITVSSLSIQVKENQGKALLALARQEAEIVQITAKATADRTRIEGQGDADRIRAIGLADAEKTRALGLADGERIKAIGLATAEATEKQVLAYGGPEYQLHSQVLLRFAEAIEKGKLALVPNISVGSGRDGQNGGGNLVEAMLAMLLSEKTGMCRNNNEEVGTQQFKPTDVTPAFTDCRKNIGKSGEQLNQNMLTMPIQYLRQKLRRFCINPADFCGLENTVVD